MTHPMPSSSQSSSHSVSIAPEIRTALNRLRSRIIGFVWFEGIALGIIWLVGMFFAGFALDYFPAKMGMDEMPVVARAVLLLFVSVVLGWLLFRYIFRRSLVQIRDKSLALLIERKFPELGDSLVTSVESAPRAERDELDLQLFGQTQDLAVEGLKKVNLDNVLNWPRLKVIISIATLLLVVVSGFAITNWPTFKLATQRLYLLDEERWPRSNLLEIVGLRVKRDEPLEGIPEFGRIRELSNDQFKIAKGSSVTLLVRALTETEDGRQLELPTVCDFRYWTKDGANGRQRLKKVGATRDGKQLFSLDGGALDGVLSDLSFQIRGGDFRLGTYKIDVVDAPTIVRTDLDCTFPNYMVDEESMRYTPRKEPWSSGMRLPQGTKVTIEAKSNKGLKKVYAINATTGGIKEFAATESGFHYPVAAIDQPINYQFYMCDVDGVISDVPHSVTIDAIEDRAPEVQTILRGIGSAITPDAVLPITGRIEDDYDVQAAWIEIDRLDWPTTKVNVDLASKGALDAQIDFRAYRQNPNGFKIEAGEQNQVAVVVKSNDFYSLAQEPNQGIGDQYVLDIVTPSELLKILEQLEVAQRRRLEQVFLEMADAREYLVRAKVTSANAGQAGAEPGDPESNDLGSSDENLNEDEQLKKHELRLLFAQRATLQVEKSEGETRGISEAFDDIRLQLINNRVDSEERKIRLQSLVIEPLKLIADDLMQQLTEQTRELEDCLRNLQAEPINAQLMTIVDRQASVAIEQCDIVLSELDGVLSVLIKYETQNELLDIVRDMIKKQNGIMERTKKERERKAFDGLLD